jgi:hypothetical protein
VTNWTAANPLRNHVTQNEIEIGFVTLGNMCANGVRTLAAWYLGRGTFFMEQCANGSLIPAA